MAVLQAPFSTWIGGSCLKHIHEKPESRPLASVTGSGPGTSKAISFFGEGCIRGL